MLLTIPMLLLLLTVVFLVLRVLPGDPLAAIETKNAPEHILEARRRELGLDQPLHVQYITYLVAIASGNLGKTAIDRYPVADLLVQRLPGTIELTVFSMVFAVGLGLFVGAHAAYRRGHFLDGLAKIYGMIIFSVPVFFLGLVFQLVFGVVLGLFPVQGRLDIISLSELPRVTNFMLVDTLLAGNARAFFSALHHLFLPSLTLGLILSGIFVRITRAHMIETLRQDYVTAARARGLRERTVLYAYGLRNSLIPIVTLVGLQFASLMAGAVLTETTFNWQGVGLLLFEGILKRDYGMVQGSVIVVAVVVAITGLVVDVIYGSLDPRIRY